MGGKNAGERGIVFSYNLGKNLLDKTMCIFSWIGQNLVIVGVFMHEAWDWVNSNSGAIQTIIAVIALVYAWKGYKKLLEQMENATDQEKKSYEQRNYELKVQFMDLMVSISDRTHENLKNQKDVLALLRQTLESHNENDDVSEDELKKLINHFEEEIEEMEQLQIKNIEFFDQMSGKDNFDFNKHRKHIDKYYKALFLMSNEANKNDLLKYIFEKVDD